MSFTDLLRDTLATLWAHKRRTLLTMFGIAWGIISITIMVAAGEGLGDGIKKNQETFGKDVMIVFAGRTSMRSEEHTSELQSLRHLVCRLLLEKKKQQNTRWYTPIE